MNKIYYCTISVPAHYNSTQRIIIKDIAKMSGLKVVRIINSPSSSGLYYNF